VCDRYYTLTRMVMDNGYNVFVNDGLCHETMRYESLTSQGTLEPSISINSQMKASKRV
jgi:hypothetical protein